MTDPIHTRIELNLFDRDLIDSPYFQRLHFVLQNSVNYVTFPANKNTRFPHSIGVAHIAGRLFSNGLSNARFIELSPFLDLAGAFLKTVIDLLYPPRADPLAPRIPGNPYKRFIDANLNTISGLARFLHVPIRADGDPRRVNTEDVCGGNEKYFKTAFVVDTYWQALRLYALMHDIGHLPMSHAFETALEEVPDLETIYPAANEPTPAFSSLLVMRKSEFSGLKEDGDAHTYFSFFKGLLKINNAEEINEVVFSKAFHEIRGLSLFNRFVGFQSNPSQSFPKTADAENISDYGRIICYITLCIIFSSVFIGRSRKRGDYHSLSFLYALRKLVDGAVDADRLDYTLRDSHEAGSKFGSFDLERVISNSLLVRNKETPSFAFGFYFQGVPGVEQFFEARYQSYKYIVYHRTASRSNSCVEHLIALMFLSAHKFPSSDLTRIIARYGYLKLNDKGEPRSIPLFLTLGAG